MTRPSTVPSTVSIWFEMNTERSVHSLIMATTGSIGESHDQPSATRSRGSLEYALMAMSVKNATSTITSLMTDASQYRYSRLTGFAETIVSSIPPSESGYVERRAEPESGERERLESGMVGSVLIYKGRDGKQEEKRDMCDDILRSGL